MLLNLLHHLAEAHAIDGFQHKIEILSRKEGALSEIIHEGRLFGAAFAYFGSHHFSRHHFLLAELRLDIEGADAIDLIAEEIEAKRQFIRKRVDIYNAASNGVLPGLIHKIHPLETEFDELLAERCFAHGLPATEYKTVGHELLLRGHFFHQRIGVSSDDNRLTISLFAAFESRQHFGSLDGVTLIRSFLPDAMRSREEVTATSAFGGLIIAEDNGQIVLYVSCFFLIFKNINDIAMQFPAQNAQHQSGQTAAAIAGKKSVLAFFLFEHAHQSLYLGVLLIQLKNIVYLHWFLISSSDVSSSAKELGRKPIFSSASFCEKVK